MNSEFAQEFARRWVNAWNAHNVEGVLEHFAEEVEFRSPYVISIADEPTGRIRGKAALQAYWSKALATVPDLHFELIDVLIGAACLTLYYKGHRGLVAETLFFDGSGRVTVGTACYSIGGHDDRTDR